MHDGDRVGFLERQINAMRQAIRKYSGEEADKALRIVSQHIDWALADSTAGEEILAGLEEGQGDKETRRQGEQMAFSPCLPVSQSPCLRLTVDRPCTLTLEWLDAGSGSGQAEEEADGHGAAESE